MYDQETGRLEPKDLPPDEGAHYGVELRLGDEVAEITRQERRVRWPDVVIPPGDTLIAHVMGNTTLRIAYRRAGKLGILERRSITLHGVP